MGETPGQRPDPPEPAAPAFWRSLEERAGDPRFAEWLLSEFPRHAAAWDDRFDRRRFLQLAGASLALAGMAGCTRQPLETIVPYVIQPEHVVPGRPQFYATSLSLAGDAVGLVVECHEGRPTKIEGNPDHPASLGAADAWSLASILGLYDPDRSQAIIELGSISTLPAFVASLRPRLEALRASGGAGLRLLTGTIVSPTLGEQVGALRRRFPAARWHQYEPAGGHQSRLGARLAFGGWTSTRYDLRQADVIVAFDSDFICSGPGSLRYGREFAGRRRPSEEMNRLYAIESSPGLTGARADHRVALAPAGMPAAMLALAHAAGLPMPAEAQAAAAQAAPEKVARWVAAAAADLRAHRGRGLIVAGEHAAPPFHVLAHALNGFLGNTGVTVEHTDPIEVEPADPFASIADLAADMRAGLVDLLVIAGGNPVYDAPHDVGFIEALRRVAWRVRLGLEEDETSEHCHWHLPLAHPLESWGDTRAFDGTAAITQPLIRPLYGGLSLHELLSRLADENARDGGTIVREAWRARSAQPDFDLFWRKVLHDGVVPGTRLPAKPVTVQPEGLRRAALDLAGRAARAAAATADDWTVEVMLRPDPGVHDGRFANNGWLQELPRPLTKVTWDNAVYLAPALAARLGLENGAEVALTSAGGKVAGPAWIQPGHPDRAVTVHLGFGRRRCGRVGFGAGFDAYPLLRSDRPDLAVPAKLARTGAARVVACTQHHFAMERRHPVRSATLARYRDEPGFARALGEAPPPGRNLYPRQPYPGHAWGMVIDLNACTGCNACVIACQSENNIPVVGKEQVAAGREMHWLRVDRYYEGPADDPRSHPQPVPCMQCEQAPCEVVCPVAATVHSSEGLNDMVYNRCVGTRYCSNNCPYKVRRFNFLAWNADAAPVTAMLRNPEVTVRSRGVMEKCTYCVQRISRTRIEAEVEGRPIRDGEIQTACQQACPTRAIVFGDVNDPGALVSRLKAQPINYGLLEGLNTRPRTTYLAKIGNPNPALEPEA